MFKQEVLLGGGGGTTLTFNKSGEEEGEEGITADRFYKGVRQVPSSVVDQGHVGTDPDPRIRASDQ